MAELGYFLSAEEHTPLELVRQAKLAEEHGFGSLWISDHYHPWLDDQGESAFVWSVIGAIAGATAGMRVGTAVTCPIIRTHPAVIAQAAATSSLLLDGRFELGVGTGENLNEHILGDRWPPFDLRASMLEESVEVMRSLWTGDEVTHRGEHYTVENARLYSHPSAAIPVLMSAFGPKATVLAAKIADGFVTTRPDEEGLDRYRAEGGRGPAAAMLRVCWGPDRDACLKLAHKLWRTSGVPGELSQELRTPAHFEQASELVTVDSMGERFPCGPDVEPIVESAKAYVDAGFDRLFISQIGPDQDGFFGLFDRELASALAEIDLKPNQMTHQGGSRDDRRLDTVGS